MIYVLNAVLKDLRRCLRDPISLIFWLVIPLAIAGLVMLATGGQRGPQLTARLLVADEDGSFLSSFLTRSFSQADTGNLVQVETVTGETGRARIARGDGSGFLLIPKGFGSAVLKRQPTKLLLVTNPEQRILPGILKGGLEILTDGIAFLQNTFGKELSQIADGPGAGQSAFPDATIATLSVSINQFIQREQKYIFPPVIEIETAADVAPGRPINLALLFFPGILLMALTFTTLGLSEDLWQERDQGTLARAVTTPGGVPCLLAGKIISALIVCTLVSSVILLIGMFYLSLSFWLFPKALLWAAATSALLLAMLMFLQTLATSRQGGSVLATAIVFPLLMLGGSFFPSESMPAWMAALGRWTPNGCAVEGLKNILLERAETGALTITFILFVVASGVLLLLSVCRLRHVFSGR